jgi:hypothetical protein
MGECTKRQAQNIGALLFTRVADITANRALFFYSIIFGFPNEMEARKSEFPLLFDTFYTGFKEEENIKAYLSSKRRMGYSMCIWRHYPELDRQA